MYDDALINAYEAIGQAVVTLHQLEHQVGRALNRPKESFGRTASLRINAHDAIVACDTLTKALHHLRWTGDES